MVGAIIVLNLIDALLTLLWVTLGVASEANPLMDELLAIGPVTFVAGKILLVSLGAILLWRQRKHALSVIGIFSVFLVYYFILIIHLRGVFVLPTRAARDLSLLLTG